MLVIENERERPQVRDIDRRMKTLRFLAKVRAPAFGRRRRATAWEASMSTSTSKSETEEWIKIDLHIHTHDDPKDAVDYSAHELLERARTLGFRVLAITLHDAVFGRQEVFADAAAMGILLIPAAEMRLHGADVIVLNVTAEEMAELKSFDDLRRIPLERRASTFTLFPTPFYIFGGPLWSPVLRGIELLGASEFCHFLTWRAY